MRIPDYNKMRDMLAWREADCLTQSDIYEILYYGSDGYDKQKDDDILHEFTIIFGTHQIPKRKADKPTKQHKGKKQCTDCGYAVCVCKPVTN